MSFQGYFDPNTYVPGDYGTYPVPAVGSHYQPGMYWVFDTAGTWDGTPVSVNDRTYVDGRARQYGDAAYGDDLYGDPPGQDWPVYVTSWTLWFATTVPWLQDPPVTGGCPLVEGWRIHVEWLEDNRVLFDDGNFEWRDVSEQVAEITLARGNEDGRQVLQVDRLRVAFVDRDAELFSLYPVATSGNWSPGDRMRVGMSDGTSYYPLMTCRTEQIDDIHDTQPRLVAVTGYGHLMDLVVPIVGWQRPAESAAARAEAIENAVTWTWSEFEYESTPGYSLVADSGPQDLAARTELDRTAMSSGWSMRTDKRGSVRFAVMPYQGGAADFSVADCTGKDEIASPVITLRNDLGEMLNDAEATTELLSSFAKGQPSIDRFGERSATQGFPLTGLATANQGDLNSITEAYQTRYGLIATRSSSVEISSILDERWVQTVAGLDLGQTVTTHRYGIEGQPLILTGQVAGYELVIEPDRRGEGKRGRITGSVSLTGSTNMILETEDRQTAGGDDRQTAGSDGRALAWGNVI